MSKGEGKRVTRRAVLGGAALAGLGVAGRAAAQPPQGAAGFGDLVGALKTVPGCLGVETARTGSGKSVIFAWFEDKKAALAWYNHDVHKRLMAKFMPDAERQDKPMAAVPDEGPVLAIASVTPNDKPTAESPAPFKQIAIELYLPVSGGLALGGRLAPEKMKVPPKRDAKK